MPVLRRPLAALALALAVALLASVAASSDAGAASRQRVSAKVRRGACAPAAVRRAAKARPAKRCLARVRSKPRARTAAPRPTSAPAKAAPVAPAPTPAAAPAPVLPSATAGTGTSAGTTPTSVPAPRLFSPDSVWNRALPADAALDATSDLRMTALLTEIRRELSARTGPWINTTEYSAPYYRVAGDVPRVPVTLDVGYAPRLKAAFAAGVPIPADAVPGRGSDAHLLVFQPSTDQLWELFGAARKADGWHARWGGAIQGVSTSQGHFTSSAWPNAGAEGLTWGSTASSLSVAGGLITMDELRAGRIDHALAVALPDACAGTFAFPAQRTDGGSRAADCVPEGAHLRLDAALDLTALKMPRITRILAEAAQRYGLVVRDRTLGPLTFYAEQPAPGTNPYRGSGGLFGGLAPWDFMPQFPWHRLQLLSMSLCTKAPCAGS